ncbi:hypothetical protein BOX15_Mlig031404g2 [Macrostomum lignano]|uniref:Uncharacterized protein n=1 Tax=Macrostomum lignano TaxID=282301 RepID=A0A267DSP5_9PLAT|nr:hypothetical protein BOX15_Mlig031404g2 [Macrostomum lignano]
MDWLIGKARGKPGGAAIASNGNSGSNSTAGPDESRLYTQTEYASKQISLSADLDSLLDQPLLLQQNEWIATHVTALYENVGTLFEAVFDFCTCDRFTGPGGVNFGVTEEKAKKARANARNQIDSALAQCQELLGQFPTRYGQAFLHDLHSASGCVLRHLLHILAHIYSAHYDAVLRLDLVPHLNTVTRHCLLFNAKFRIVEDRELDHLADLQAALFGGASAAAGGRSL